MTSAERTAKRTGILLALLALLGSVVAPGGFVLCIVQGEHAAIEPAVEIEPCGVPLQSDGVGAPTRESCSDAPIAQVPLRRADNDGAKIAPLVALLSLVEFCPLDIVAARAVQPPAETVDRRALRAIVLLV